MNVDYNCGLGSFTVKHCPACFSLCTSVNMDCSEIWDKYHEVCIENG